MTSSLQATPVSTASPGLMVPPAVPVCQSRCERTRILDSQCFFDQAGEIDARRAA